MFRKTLSNKLPNNLPQLQNLIKRNSDSYRDEFLQQLRHYQSHIEVFRIKPTKFVKTLNTLILFLAHVAPFYRNDLDFYPQELYEILQNHGVSLDPVMRMTFVQALILMRSKNLIQATKILELFFKLFRCQDKLLRKTLYDYIISDIRRMNSKNIDSKLNSTLQNYMYTMLRDNNQTAAKMSLEVMIDLYRRNIWNNSKVVNVIATGCLSKYTKILIPSLKFFITPTEDHVDEDDDYCGENDVPEERKSNIKKVKTNLRIGKKTRKRRRIMKQKLKTKTNNSNRNSESLNFTSLQMLHDPQDFAEKLFDRLQSSNEKFKVKLLMMDLISRLIGIHQLIICNFYSFLQRFLNPRQEEVIKLLLFAAQACHPLVPPDLVEDVLHTIANNFITEHNLTDAVVVGLNAVREICVRCPLSMSEQLLQDLVQYKSHKVKSVMTAGRSLLQLFRYADPEMLKKKDRGKPQEPNRGIWPKKYGEIDVLEHIPGIETLSSCNIPSISCKSSVENDNDDNRIRLTYDDDKDSSHDIVQKKKAQEILSSNILTPEDFNKIQEYQLNKNLLGRINKRRISDSNIDGLPVISSIEHVSKHRKRDDEKAVKEDKVKSVYHKERSNPFASTTNKEKNKNKNYSMLRPKVNFRRNKRSFREKQVLLRENLLRQARLKRKRKI